MYKLFIWTFNIVVELIAVKILSVKGIYIVDIYFGKFKLLFSFTNTVVHEGNALELTEHEIVYAPVY